MALDIINPATKKTYKTIQVSTLDDVNNAVERAKVAFKEWSAKSHEERSAALHNVANAIEKAGPELAEIVTAEQGKPLFLAQFEVGGAVGWTHYNADLKLEPEVLEDSAERRVEVHRMPVGVVASITPWNWPLMIAIWHIMPALRAGNSVVIKPSSLTPINTLRLVDIINEHTVPNLVQAVIGEREVGEPLVSHPDVKKVVFTGSTPVGKRIASLVAGDLKKVTLELGGNDAGIVLENANIDKIAEKIFMTSFVNMGQTCACLKRLYVHRSKYEALCDALVKIAAAQVVGNGMQEGVTFGPVQNVNQYEKVKAMIIDARESGAEVIAADLPSGLDGYFIAPTIIKNPQHNIDVVCHEQFGPVLPVIPYDDLNDVMSKAIHEEFALGGSVWGEPCAELDWVVDQLDSGTVWVNNHAEVLPHVPFGGNKSSGLGVEFGMEGLLENTVRKVINRAK
ncbi:MAG: aldehyde dehydrogenase family protein [Gammaproteobacteria bacterium]|jgi:acyl-CoA reductase-like NAD-dependent aldehyde dehydrogenase|uniref:aldehyde dehydrogenase family protein n=1 Tax=Marinomonas TaxID=28253 RepID=UPI000C1EA812|nr:MULTISPECIES: aldehyde dehydrogenase family protein [unclassified Marinomonas]MBU1296823.1 aldehyde dehydrogenase family protein [Gammaproteobacteria bacterium]MBU1466887.1 aldehyde dehydrogenase family protein [Gammaproteobacteria bacterium]MBU2021734.1 aldehyde dehydrogenase family protein [Gammaproteobacteria bacterium]MBU2237760.1 aldehyde dehydrogenase family protein [Gammaproteobacteria bacterium]MBU2319911.1 aldehyde dehydrogenase family protein [Gammaproteobacteria bacterium]